MRPTTKHPPEHGRSRARPSLRLLRSVTVTTLATVVVVSCGDDDPTDGVLVGASAHDVAEGDQVQVTGTVEQFDRSGFEEELGVDLDESLYAGYAEEVAILAESVEPIPDPGE